MTNYRTFHVSSNATAGELFIRTLIRVEGDDEPSADVLLFQTTRGATIWLTAADVEAVTSFCRAELLSWQAENDIPDDVVDAQIMCGNRLLYDGSRYECCLVADHLPVYAGQWTHITNEGAKFNGHGEGDPNAVPVQ